MADPFTWAMIGMGSSMAGAGVGAVGSLMQGSAQAGMYGYQSGMAQLAAKVAEQNRQFAIESGQQQERSYGIGARARMGEIIARQGASNIDVGSGSPADVQRGQQTAADIDLGTLRYNTARRAYGFEVEKTQDIAQAGLYQMAASGARTAGEIGAGTSLLGGVASVSDKWLQASSMGILS